jgi:hypothetical protein
VLADARAARGGHTSCGPEALKRATKDRHLEIEYDGSTVRVNGTRWERSRNQRGIIDATTSEAGRTWMILLSFRRAGARGAHGSLTVAEAGGDGGNFRCADAVVFRDGTYAK